MTKTIELSDGATVEAVEADGVDDVTLYAVSATVSGSEKVNLGNYENAEPHVSVRTEIRPAVRLDADGQTALQGHLADLRSAVADHLQHSVDERLADNGSVSDPR
jgi:urease accessory protein UreF